MAEMTPEQFSQRLKEAVRTGALSDAIVGAGQDLAFAMERGAKRRVTGGNPLNVRTGKLRQSIKPTVREIRGGVRAGVQAGSRRVPYAHIHETGETRDGKTEITPKRGKFLRIPFPNGPGVTRAGQDRFHSAMGRGEEFQFVPLPGDRGMLVNRFTQDPWYLLVKSVKIKKRPFLRPAREAAMKGAPHIMIKHLIKALRTVGLGA
jgi:hypothetical protein